MIKIKLKKLREEKDAGEQKLNSIQKHNLNILLNDNYTAGHGAKRGQYLNIADNFLDDLGSQHYERTGNPDVLNNVYALNTREFMTKVVQGVPSLSSSKITNAITGDSYGKIFKLDNEHILKLFLGGVNVKSDMKWYNKCYKNMFRASKGKPTMLPVYGEPGKLTIGSYFVWYVEMAEVIPFDKFAERTGRFEDPDGIISQTKALFLELYDVRGIRNFDELVKEFISFIFPGKHAAFHHSFKPDEEGEDEEKLAIDVEEIIKTLNPLSRKEVVALLRVFFDMRSMGIKLSDVASRNMGVLAQDPETIVIFDR